MRIFVRRIVRTIEEIIQLSAINSGNYELHFESFNFKEEVLVPILQHFENAANTKDLKFIFSEYSNPGKINRDKFMVHQIFQEIIDNAVKFTDSGQIQVSTYLTENKKFAVNIKDTGIGMSNEFMEHIFEPFAQEYTGYSRKFEGNGLALALVKKYAELNNLFITVKSIKGLGTEFSIVFN